MFWFALFPSFLEGISACRANILSGVISSTRLTQKQLRKPRVRHLYFGARLRLNWYGGACDKVFAQCLAIRVIYSQECFAKSLLVLRLWIQLGFQSSSGPSDWSA